MFMKCGAHLPCQIEFFWHLDTTKQTLALAGSDSLLSTISISSSSESQVPFIDRDPELFSIILSLLRTGNLPLRSKSFDLQDLIFECQFYGIESLLLNSMELSPSYSILSPTLVNLNLSRSKNRCF
ncbi:hypothetical protein Ancab_036675 [Ancistrocladus abbreviatus]